MSKHSTPLTWQAHLARSLANWATGTTEGAHHQEIYQAVADFGLREEK